MVNIQFKQSFGNAYNWAGAHIVHPTGGAFRSTGRWVGTHKALTGCYVGLATTAAVTGFSLSYAIDAKKDLEAELINGLSQNYSDHAVIRQGITALSTSDRKYTDDKCYVLETFINGKASTADLETKLSTEEFNKYKVLQTLTDTQINTMITNFYNEFKNYKSSDIQITADQLGYLRLLIDEYKARHQDITPSSDTYTPTTPTTPGAPAAPPVTPPTTPTQPLPTIPPVK